MRYIYEEVQKTKETGEDTRYEDEETQKTRGDESERELKVNEETQKIRGDKRYWRTQKIYEET